MEKADLIIVGGGIFGCAIAYYYSRDNPGKKVVLLERNGLNSGATSRAAALMTVVRPKRSYIPLSLETYKVISLLEKDLNESLGMQCVGMLHVAASEQTVNALVELEGIGSEFDREVSTLSSGEANHLVPWLKTDDLLKIALMSGEGFCDPYLLGTFFARCAQQQRAILKQGIEVKALLIDKNRVVGINTSEGKMSAPVVVDAAGVWAPILANQAGFGLPMAPVRSQYWITQKAEYFPPNSPMVLLPDAQAYTRPDSGALIIGIRESKSMVTSPADLPKDLAAYAFSPDEGRDDLAENGAKLARFFPKLYDTRIRHFMAGFSGYTPDGQLVLGEVPGVQGLLVASGCCGAGISVAGGVGLGIASLAAGSVNPFDFSEFRLDRFGSIDAFDYEWLARCAAARSQKVSG
ncbi:NAD(P)/FAD-dependent oxidoreductase [Lunatibacter salilacus]|uniref:NAD(P)/FAD-dependent oxidoreductase n=1 Tax=Lunatibacter salilacus TaxID=2483804 RepID=UPI00131AE77A|nr:FAD-binding oxidoreductase [Lunatibacter salilacus]